MKKVFSLVLVLILTLSVFSGLTVFALNEELLQNCGFEMGDTTGYSKSYNVKGTVAKEYAHTGNYGLLITNRKVPYDNYGYDITQIVKDLNGGFFSISMYMRISDKQQPSANGVLVLCILKTDGTKSYSVSGRKALTTKYQQFNIDAIFSENDLKNIEKLSIYPQTPATNDESKIPDICVDDFSLVKNADKVSLNTSVLNKTREEKTTVGAIRWDAWYSHDGRDGSIVSAVEKSLSPAQFHYRAPFFAEVTEENKIVMPQYTQEIFDREMEYAMYAGIDYFAYVWYSGAMAMARKFHTTSKYKNNVKLCVLFDNNAINKDFAREEMRTILKEDYYVTVLDGRPLMYYLYSGSNLSEIHDDIVYYNNLTKELGIPEPFAVIMGAPTDKAKHANANAVSKYAYNGSGLTYKELALSVQKEWEELNKSGMQYVPCVTGGWSPEPRYYNPPFWTATNGGVKEGSWCEDATSEELFEHLSYALSYMQHENVQLLTKINSVIIYAWNEHDEGGWICPTLAVDKDGKQIYNDDGTKKLNESRLNAVKLAIDLYKQGKTVSVSVNGVKNSSTVTSASSYYENLTELLNKKVYEGIEYNTPLNTPTPSPVITPSITAQTQQSNMPPIIEEKETQNYTWLYVAGGIVVCSILACLIVIVIKKKNK